MRRHVGGHACAGRWAAVAPHCPHMRRWQRAKAAHADAILATCCQEPPFLAHCGRTWHPCCSAHAWGKWGRHRLRHVLRGGAVCGRRKALAVSTRE